MGPVYLYIEEFTLSCFGRKWRFTKSIPFWTIIVFICSIHTSNVLNPNVGFPLVLHQVYRPCVMLLSMHQIHHYSQNNHANPNRRSIIGSRWTGWHCSGKAAPNHGKNGVPETSTIDAYAVFA